MSVQPAKGGQLSIQELIKNLDIDGDGDIDDEDLKIKEILMKMDQDGDGLISLRELVNIGKGKMEDEKKMGNLKKIMYVGAAVAAVFIILSLSVTIAAIELTKESRNSDSTMIDATSGKPVATAVLTGDMDALTGKKDTAMKDSDGNLASVGVATGSAVLDSRTMTVDTAKMITSLTLPVKSNGATMTVSVSVSGFEMASDGSKVIFYTTSGGMVRVAGEDITYFKKGIDGVIRSLTVDPARPGTRRFAMRKRSSLRRSRSLLQMGGNSTNSTDSCTGAACGTGQCTDASCQPTCNWLEVWNSASGSCECIPGADYTTDDWGYTYCKCSGDNIPTWFMDDQGNYRDVCAACPGDSTATEDGYNCYGCAGDTVFEYGQPPNATGPPKYAGTCKECPPGMQRKEESWDDGYTTYNYAYCECRDPCKFEDYMSFGPNRKCTDPCAPGEKMAWYYEDMPGYSYWWWECLDETFDPDWYGGEWCDDVDFEDPPGSSPTYTYSPDYTSSPDSDGTSDDSPTPAVPTATTYSPDSDDDDSPTPAVPTATTYSPDSDDDDSPTPAVPTATTYSPDSDDDDSPTPAVPTATTYSPDDAPTPVST